MMLTGIVCMTVGDMIHLFSRSEIGMEWMRPVKTELKTFHLRAVVHLSV
jgi:hypothetical protein